MLKPSTVLPFPAFRKRDAVILLASALLVAFNTRADDAAGRQVGASLVRAAPKGGLGGGAKPLDPVYRTAQMATRAAPTNQWYSSVMFQRWSQPIHAHPATYRAGPEGFEIGYPKQTVVPAGGRGADIAYPHQAALTIAPVDFTPQDARLAGHGDFSATIAMGDAANHVLQATVVHGSPLSYYTITDGSVKVRLAKGAVPCDGKAAAQILCVRVQDRHFAVYAPPDASWSGIGSAEPVIRFGPSGRFFSVALLPDGSAETIARVEQHAYAFVTDTRADWHYDRATSKVETTFSATVESRAKGETTPLLGLYPHQARRLVGEAGDGLRYDSIRGPIRTIAGRSFKVASTYHGILPFWGKLQDDADRERLASVMVGDKARSRTIFSRQQGQGTYWFGKAVGATAQLMNVAEQEGDSAMRDELLAMLKGRLEGWFRGDGTGYFVQDGRLGSLLGYPDEYGSVTNMNDHHFHYGYWLNAAAQVALRDPAWAAPGNWGGMVNLLAADIATPARDRADYPFVRNFDPYEGHSWASGDADFADGNNQESSSEAVNAWAGLILWGEATGNVAMRDLGIWLYTQETEAIAEYWFDLPHTLFPPTFGKVVAAQVFGGRYSYNTWWTEEPRQIQGINLLPMTAASVYLGADPAYIRRSFDALATETRAYSARGMSDGTPKDIWQDIFALYLGLADPAAALAQYRPKGDSESGETRSHSLHWLLSLKEMGTPDFSITADTALYGVFRQPDGKRTYLAYNAGMAPLSVTFSDGKTLQVMPHQLGRLN